jgi:hypothetical protein
MSSPRRGIARVALAAALALSCATITASRIQRSLEYMLGAETAGDWEEAARYAAEAEAALPRGERLSVRALYILRERAKIAVAAGRDEEAEALYEDLSTRIEGEWPGAPSAGESLNELAKLRVARGDVEGARDLWQRVLALEREGNRASDAQRAFAYAGLARLANDAGDTALADDLFRKAITQGSTTDEAFWDLRIEYGALLRALGRAEDASRVEAGAAPPTRARHYLWQVGGWRRGLDPFDERYVQRWPDDRMPLRVYLPEAPADAFPGQTRDAVRAAVIGAIESWTDVVRPGVPSFAYVDSSWSADLRFRWTEVSRDLRVGEVRMPVHGGFRPGTIRVATKWSPRVGAPLEAVRLVVIHEVGHAIGLWGHSPEPGDIMFRAVGDAAKRVATGISPRDKETLRLLYSLAPGATLLRTGLP